MQYVLQQIQPSNKLQHLEHRKKELVHILYYYVNSYIFVSLKTKKHRFLYYAI